MSDTKFCSRGSHEVSVTLFSKSSSKPDGLFAWCKDCMSSYERERYSNGDNARKARNKRVTLEKNRDYIWDILSRNPCMDCGNSDPRVLHFDHIDPEIKLFNIGNMFWDYSITKIDEEIAKCVVRCANCHTIRTNEQFGYWKTTRDDSVS